MSSSNERRRSKLPLKRVTVEAKKNGSRSRTAEGKEGGRRESE